MRRILQFLTFSLAALFALGIAQAAQAQDTPKVEVFGGYSYMRANIVIDGTAFNLNGASGSVAYNVNHWLGVVGDVGVYHQGSVTGNGLSLTLSSYQFGPRVSLRKNKHLVPFGQALLGAGHAGGTLYTSSLGTGLAPLGTNNGFLLTAGDGRGEHEASVSADRKVVAAIVLQHKPRARKTRDRAANGVGA